jgi:Phosphoribosyl transferase domain
VGKKQTDAEGSEESSFFQGRDRRALGSTGGTDHRGLSRKGSDGTGNLEWQLDLHGRTVSTGRVEFDHTALPLVHGRHVLLLDDILDSGNTLTSIIETIRVESGPLSLKSCVLLRKKKNRSLSVQADYVGFDIEDEFVVGYGLDYQERYRNLPLIGVLKI